MPRRLRPIRAWQGRGTTPVLSGQAAEMEAALDQALVRSVGALPVLLPLCAQLGLRESINRHCYPDGVGAEEIEVGCMALVLILNRLQAPQPLVHVETWLAGTVLPEVLGLDAAQCNDDRLARTLDTLLPHLDAIWQDLIVAAISAFDLDLRYLCYDLTSISFCGAYEDADLLRYGYSRDHRPDRKQIELAATMTAAGGVPLDYRALAGNVADRATPVANLQRLQGLLALLPPRDPAAPCIVVSDRAMLTAEALAAYARSKLCYLGPLDPGLGQGVVQDLLAAVSAEELAAHPLPYRPQRAADDPDWVAYQGMERPLFVPHPDPSAPPLEVRALVVWSPGKAAVRHCWRRPRRSMAAMCSGRMRPLWTRPRCWSVPNSAMCPRSALPWSKVPWPCVQSMSIRRSACWAWCSAPWSRCCSLRCSNWRCAVPACRSRASSSWPSVRRSPSWSSSCTTAVSCVTSQAWRRHWPRSRSLSRGSRPANRRSRPATCPRGSSKHRTCPLH